MSMVTGGELVARALKANGISHLFTLPGVGLFSIYDACARHGIEIVGGRHEECVAQSAEGWARVSGRPGVAAVAEGGGHANAVPGVATAYSECTPLILLSAIDEVRHLKKGAVQELPQVEMCAPIAKWSALVTDARRLPACLEKAFALAMHGVPGPVHLSLPFDVMEQPVDEAEVEPVPAAPVWPGTDQADGADFVEQTLELLARAERPVIIAGIAAYWAGAGVAMRRFVETTRIPLFTVERARGLVPDDHPYCFGDGYTTVNPVGETIHHADVILLLGEKIDCRFAYGSSFGRAKIIHVWPDPQEIGKNRAADASATGDVRIVAERLAEAAAKRSWNERAVWIESLRQARRRHADEIAPLAESADCPPHPLRIAREVERFIDRDTILVFDGGDFSGWMRYYFQALRPGGWQVGTVLGQLGTGLPFALGAKLAARASKVVLLTGDGALGFCAMEFETAVRCRVPVVTIVGNDAAWGIEVFFQDKRAGSGGRVGTDLGPVRWDRVASAMGAHGEHVDKPAELGPAMERAFACGGPACVDVTMRSLPSPQALAYARVFARRRARLRHAMAIPAGVPAP